MASFFCHVFGGTKRFRLERIVRPLPLTQSDARLASRYGSSIDRFIAATNDKTRKSIVR